MDRIVVVAHPRWLEETRRLVDEANLPVEVHVVAGGATRNESTRNGLNALDAADDDVIVVHDAVRPLVPVEVVQRSIEPVASGRADATDTVIPCADTLVIVEGEDVVEIPDRGRYRRGQTPQVFRKSVLEPRVRGGASGSATCPRPTTAASSCATSRGPASSPSPATRSTSRSRRRSTWSWRTG